MEKQLLEQMQCVLIEAELALLALEQATRDMAIVRAEGVAACLEEREKHFSQLQMLMEEAKLLADEDETGVLHRAINPATDYDMIPEAARPVFERRQSINAAVCRVLALEKQAAGHIALEREKLLGQIRENNEGQSAKASKFLDAMRSGNDRVFFPAKQKQI